jgi:hypothetical protein
MFCCCCRLWGGAECNNMPQIYSKNLSFPQFAGLLIIFVNGTPTFFIVVNFAIGKTLVFVNGTPTFFIVVNFAIGKTLVFVNGTPT